MKTYLRQNYKYNGYKISIDYVDDNFLTIKVWKRIKDFDLGDLAYNDLPDFSKTYTKHEFLKDHYSKLPINENHVYMLLAVPYLITSEVKVIAVNVFKHTYPSKTSLDYLRKINSLKPLLHIAIPLTTSKISDWTIIAEAEKCTVNNIEVTETHDFNGLKSIEELLPSIKLTKDNQDNIYVQLLNADGTDAHKENIEVYLETTTGTLQENRVVTDSLGKAQTKLLLKGKGKIKAGFKFYAGKTEIDIV